MVRRGIWAAVLAACLGVASGAFADARTDFLIRMLATSNQFRVRAQAALALGSQKADASVLRALGSGLHDEHPAVRAASAAALERLKDPRAVPDLRGASNDPDGAVRTAVRNALAALEPPKPPTGKSESGSSGGATFYVGVGTPGSQVSLSQQALRTLREQVARQVAQIDGVRLAPENEARAAANKVIGRDKLVGYFVDSSVTKIEQRPDGSVRAQVSVIVGTYPGRDIRAMLTGAATVSGGGSGEAAKLQAIEAAFQGALRRLPQAMQAGLARAP